MWTCGKQGGVMRAVQIMAACGVAGLLSCTAMAAGTGPAAQLERFELEAGRRGKAEAGREFFLKKHGNDWACASCHGEVDPQWPPCQHWQDTAAAGAGRQPQKPHRPRAGGQMVAPQLQGRAQPRVQRG